MKFLFIFLLVCHPSIAMNVKKEVRIQKNTVVSDLV